VVINWLVIQGEYIEKVGGNRIAETASARMFRMQ
jgi:hypothetical protein